MPNVTITQLPAAGPITGTELVPIVQNGQTVRTNAASIAGSPSQTQTFLTVNQEPTLPNSRSLSGGSGIGLVDGGAQSTLQITLNGASGSLESVSPGMLAKTGATTIANRTLTASGVGLSITNGSGVSGNPTFALSGLAASLANLGGVGFVGISSIGTATSLNLLGTTNQINVAGGDATAGNAVFSLANNTTIPGNEGVYVPSGTSAQRGTGVDGKFRYNSDTPGFEGYIAGAWTPLATTLSAGVTSVGTGFGLTGGPITSTGTISVDSTVIASVSGTQTLTNKTLSGASNTFSNIPNSALTYSSITINGNTVALGGSTTITAANPYALTIGTGLTGTSYNGSSAVTIAIDSTVATLTGSQTLTNKSMSGSSNTFTNIPNSALTNSSTTVGTTVLTLGGTTLTLGGLTSVTVTQDPVSALQLATKQYVDAQAGSGSVTSVNVSGGTTGLTYSGGPITTSGTITMAGTLNVANGGTGATSLTANNVLLGNGTSAVQTVAPGTAGNVLTSNGTTWVSSTPSTGGTVTSVDVSGGTTGLTTSGGPIVTSGTITLAGTLNVANGGTGSTTLAANNVLLGNGTSALQAVAPGSAGNVLTSNGTTWVSSTPSTGGTVTSVDVSGGTTGLTFSGGPVVTSGTITMSGTLGIANGGTGGTTFAANNVLLGNGTSSFQAVAPGSAGNVLTSNGTTWVSSTPSTGGTVTSVAMTVPTGLSISGSPITTSGTLAVTYTTGYSIPTNASQTNWDTAYSERLQWDGGSTNLVASTGRTSLGATTLGSNLFTITNPSAVTFPRFNADNTVSALDASTFRSAIGAGTGSGSVTSIDVSGGTTGLTTSGGPVTSSGTITLAGTLNVANGGTGSTTLAANNVLLGNGTSALQAVAPGTAGNVLTSNGTTWVSSTPAAGGTVTSVAMTVPTGLSISGSPITSSGTLALTYDTGYSIPTTASQSNWDTAYTDRLKWDGGATGLVASTGRTSLGATTIGSNLFTLTNPSAITFPRFNADDTVSALDAATFRSAIGAGTGSGTVTSVALTVPTGLSISGSPITTSGTLALTLQSGYSIPTTASQSSWDTAYFERLQWDGGSTNLVASTGRTSLGLGTAATMAGPSGTIVGTTDTQTLTNKSITPRVYIGFSVSGTQTPDSDSYDIIAYAFVNGALTINPPTMSLATDGRKLIFRIYDNGTAQTISWSAVYKAIGVTLPTSTLGSSKMIYVGVMYNALGPSAPFWDVVAVTNE